MNRGHLAAQRLAHKAVAKPFAISLSTITRTTVKGTVKRTTTHCVHELGRRTWEGAHYNDPAKAWRFAESINKNLGAKP